MNIYNVLIKVGFKFNFKINTLITRLKKLSKKLSEDICSTPAIIPPMPWIDNKAPKRPLSISKNRNKLIWEVENTENEFDKNRFFVLYRYDINAKRFLKSQKNMLAITGESFFSFPGEIPEGIYRVSSLDRLNNESQLSEPFTVE